MKILNKIFISLLITTFLTFSLFSNQKVYANAAVAPQLQQASQYLINSGAAVLPPVFLVAVALVGAGVVYENREEIIYTATQVYQGAKDGIIDLGNGAYKITQSAMDYINSSAESLFTNITEFIFPSSTNFATPENVALINSINTSSTQITMYNTQKYVNGVWSSLLTHIISVPTGAYFIATLNAPLSKYDQPCVRVDYYNADGTPVGFPNEYEYFKPMSTAYTVYPVATPITVSLPQTMFPDRELNPPVSLPVDVAISVPLNPTVSDFDTVIGVDSVTAIPNVTFDTPVDVPVDTTIPLDWSVPLNPPVSLDFSPLTMDLKSKFPFSIPWDIKKSIESLIVTPQAPKWTITFPAEYFGSNASFDIDFKQFQIWADIVRWGILITFSFGLILITRKVIGG